MNAKNYPEAPRLARALTAAPRDAETLVSAEQSIERGGGRALLEALIAEQRGEDVDRRTVVERVMAVLEEMTDANPRVAGHLMVRLFPVAGHRGVHDVHDAIPLFIEGSTDPRVADVLDALAADRTIPTSLKQACQAWSRRLRARKAP